MDFTQYEHKVAQEQKRGNVIMDLQDQKGNRSGWVYYGNNREQSDYDFVRSNNFGSEYSGPRPTSGIGIKLNF